MTSLAEALLPLLEAEADRRSDATTIIFISGAQGIGKSTALHSALQALGPRAIGLGIDDFYLPKADRQRLADDIHPLFATRGPPGTHDVPLLIDTLTALKTAQPGTELTLPRFSKRGDDRATEPARLTLEDRPRLIILEGWLMGAEPDPAAPSDAPLNAVEAEDTAGNWRRHQEAQLAGPYAALWDMADRFIHLDAPGFETVLGWRLEQEAGNLATPPGTLTDAETRWVKRFIQHYERLTRRLLAGKRRKGHVIQVNARRQVMS